MLQKQYKMPNSKLKNSQQTVVKDPMTANKQKQKIALVFELCFLFKQNSNFKQKIVCP